MSREAEIEAAARAAMQAWPTIRLPFERFLAHLNERLGPEDDVHSLQIEDLYLACACLHGDAAAWRELDRVHLSRLPSFVARIDASPAFGDEIRQRLSEKLLRDSGDGRPKLALYSGKGALGGWLRVASVREAQDLKRVQRSTAGESKIQLVDTDDDPEVRLAKQRYAVAFKSAFEEVVKTLSPDRRSVLRLHYLDGLTLEEVGRAYGVSRATAARWIAEAREAMMTRIRAALADELGRGAGGPASVLAYVDSKLDLSLQRQFSLGDAAQSLEANPEDAPDETDETD